MTSFFKIFVVFAMFCLALGAEAQFETVQIPDGMDFQCDEEWTLTECEEELATEIYWEEHGDFRETWDDKLVLGVDHFFSDDIPSGKIDEDFDTPHLIDAQYIRHYRWEYWAFAIIDGCDRFGHNCRPLLRILTRINENNDATQKAIPESIRYPKTLDALGKLLGEIYLWQETDLQSCKEALKHLEKFPAQNSKAMFWHPHYLSELKGREVRDNISDDEDEIIVTTHGATVTLRARGKKDPLDPYFSGPGRYVVYSQGSRYEGYQWAEKMKDIVEPCLKPSNATPPWEKVLAEEAAKSKE